MNDPKVDKQWEKEWHERVHKAFGTVTNLTQHAEIPETLIERLRQVEEDFKRKGQPRAK